MKGQNVVSSEEAKVSLKEDLQKLSKHEVIPEDIYKTGKSRRLYPRACYKKSWEYVNEKENVEGVKLVHGKYSPSLFDYHAGHAWVELPNNIVFDGNLQRFYPKDLYYQHFKIIKEAEYTRKEMWEKGFEHGGNYGPWH